MKFLKTVSAILLIFGLSSFANAGYMRGDHFSLDEFYSAIRAVEKANPHIVTIHEFGKSVEGRPLLDIIIKRTDGKKKSEVLITGNVHANEWMGGRVALSIAQRLAETDGNDEWVTSILDNMEFHIIPLMNPDGYAVAAKHLDRGFTLARDNANHVDLNRNWPQVKDSSIKNARGAALGGSNFKWHPNYRGPHPLSEPENIALNELVKNHEFFVAYDLHTVGGRYSYPWSYLKDPAPSQEIFESIGEELVNHQNMYQYKVHQSFEWYQIVGASKDWFLAEYGILAATIEVGNPKAFNKKKIGLRIFNPFYQGNPADIQAWILNDRDAVLHATQKAYELTDGKPQNKIALEWEMGN
jgi:predicted deacylase